MESSLESELAFQIRACNLPEPQRQFRFIPDRKFRADFAWPEYRILVECQGGKWIPGGGGHQRAERWEQDIRRMNIAQTAGWCFLQYTGDMIHSGEAIGAIEREIAKRMGKEKLTGGEAA